MRCWCLPGADFVWGAASSTADAVPLPRLRGRLGCGGALVGGGCGVGACLGFGLGADAVLAFAFPVATGKGDQRSWWMRCSLLWLRFGFDEDLR